jgi:predicted MFS family arabinose efflux permease
VGTVAGELAGVWLIPATRRGRLTAPLAACGFMPFVIFALRPPLVSRAGAAGLFGAYMLGLNQLLLDVTPPEQLGRAYAVNSSGLMTAQGVGFAAAGALGEVVPPDVAITIAGGTGLLVVTLFRPRRRDAPTPESAAGPGRPPAAR